LLFKKSSLTIKVSCFGACIFLAIISGISPLSGLIPENKPILKLFSNKEISLERFSKWVSVFAALWPLVAFGEGIKSIKTISEKRPAPIIIRLALTSAPSPYKPTLPPAGRCYKNT
jgi:hypothetical protein